MAGCIYCQVPLRQPRQLIVAFLTHQAFGLPGCLRLTGSKFCGNSWTLACFVFYISLLMSLPCPGSLLWRFSLIRRLSCRAGQLSQVTYSLWVAALIGYSRQPPKNAPSHPPLALSGSRLCVDCGVSLVLLAVAQIRGGLCSA